MALFRCAACGSPNVVTDTQKEGYDYVKGAIGTVVLGVGGAVAGLDGKEKTVYKCPDCGTTLSYCMSEQLKAIIDMGVSSEEMRAHLKLNGVPVNWASLSYQYRNIDNAQPHAARQMRNDLREAAVVNMAQATKEDFDASVDCIINTWRKFGYYGQKKGVTDYYSPENLYTLEDYIQYKSSVIIFIENCLKFIPPNSNLYIKYRGLDPSMHINSLLCEYLLIKYEERTRNSAMSMVTTYEYGQELDCNSNLDKMIKYNRFLTEFIRRYSATNALSISSVEQKLMDKGCYSRALFKSIFGIDSYIYAMLLDKISGVYFSIWFPLYFVINGKLHHGAYRPEFGFDGSCSSIDIGEMITNYCESKSIDSQKIYDAFAEIGAELNPIEKRLRALQERNYQIKNKEIKQKQAELEPLLKPRLFGRKKAEADAAAVRQLIADLNSEVKKNEAEVTQLMKDYTAISLKTHDLLNKFDYFMVWEEQ